MIIHCTQKFSAKLPVVSTVPFTETGTLCQWHGHLYIIDRRQCVMFYHDTSRFVLFLSGVTGKQFANLDTYFRECFFASLRRSGVKESRLKVVNLALGPVRYDTATNHSVLGSMKMVRSDLEGWLYRIPNVMDLDPVEVSYDINQRPATISKQWIRPDQRMFEASGRLIVALNL